MVGILLCLHLSPSEMSDATGSKGRGDSAAVLPERLATDKDTRGCAWERALLTRALLTRAYKQTSWNPVLLVLTISMFVFFVWGSLIQCLWRIC